MAKISYYLKSGKHAVRQIIMQISIGGYVLSSDGKKRYTPVRLNTGISIPPNQWHEQRACVKPDKKNKKVLCPIAYEINRRLDEAEQIALKIAFEAKSVSQLKDAIMSSKELMQTLGKKQKSTDDVYSFIREHIETSDTSPRYKDQQMVSLRSIIEFDKSRNTIVSWSDMDYNYYSSYILYLRNKGLKNNTLGRYIRDLLVFLRSAKKAKKDVPEDFMLGMFVKPSQKVDSVYLTEAEISKLIGLDYSNNTRLDNARDWFVVACNTGLRVSDLMRLTSEHINGNNIFVKTQKTGADVIIPITKELKSIIDKYDGGFPRPISDVKYNKYIKEVCSDAGIIKNAKISSHTARRSFATNFYQKGIPASNLMLITGHTTESSFYKYIRTGLGENADLMREKFPELFI